MSERSPFCSVDGSGTPALNDAPFGPVLAPAPRQIRAGLRSSAAQPRALDCGARASDFRGRRAADREPHYFGSLVLSSVFLLAGTSEANLRRRGHTS